MPKDLEGGLKPELPGDNWEKILPPQELDALRPTSELDSQPVKKLNDCSRPKDCWMQRPASHAAPHSLSDDKSNLPPQKMYEPPAPITTPASLPMIQTNEGSHAPPDLVSTNGSPSTLLVSPISPDQELHSHMLMLQQPDVSPVVLCQSASPLLARNHGYCQTQDNFLSLEHEASAKSWSNTTLLRHSSMFRSEPDSVDAYSYCAPDSRRTTSGPPLYQYFEHEPSLSKTSDPAFGAFSAGIHRPINVADFAHLSSWTNPVPYNHDPVHGNSVHQRASFHGDLELLHDLEGFEDIFREQIVHHDNEHVFQAQGFADLETAVGYSTKECVVDNCKATFTGK
jgi:hypothetical protein